MQMRPEQSEHKLRVLLASQLRVQRGNGSNHTEWSSESRVGRECMAWSESAAS